MQFLLDTTAEKLESLRSHQRVRGQLLTPLTRYRQWQGEYAIDNGAFSRFDRDGWNRLTDRSDWSQCLFVTMPDVVGNARRTLEAFHYCALFRDFRPGMPKALAIQDGIEDLPIPWMMLDAIFVGGTTEFKLSRAAADVIRTAQIFGKHVHVGRINTSGRWRYFEELGVDTCDGSGASIYTDATLAEIESADHGYPLLENS